MTRTKWNLPFLFSKGAVFCDCKMSEATQYQIAEEQNTIFTQKNRSHATEQKKWEYSVSKKWNYQCAKWILIKVEGKERDGLACNDGNNRAVQTPERMKYHASPFTILRRALKLRGNLFRFRKELRLGNAIFIKQFHFTAMTTVQLKKKKKKNHYMRIYR